MGASNNTYYNCSKCILVGEFKVHATAFLIGIDEKSSDGLLYASLDYGFSATLNYLNMDLVEKQMGETPLCFFLFSLDKDIKKIPEVVKLIRFNKNKNIRYAPIVGFTKSPDPKIVNACLQFGFDDIVVSPFSIEKTLARQKELVGKNISFYETSTYFGPDRRRAESPNMHRDKLHPKRGEGGDYRKVVISRNSKNGIELISDEYHKNDENNSTSLGQDAKKIIGSAS